ncbi:MAG: ATPase domain-containing protein [Candidatus Diapherotrites archaeon]
MPGKEKELAELEALLAEMKEMNVQLKNKIGSLEDDFIGLMIINELKLAEAGTELLRILRHDENMPGIYITANKPYATMVKHLEKQKVDIEGIFFIDCVSHEGKNSAIKNDSCVVVDGLKELTQLEIAFEKAIKGAKNNEIFIVLDSISTLMIYHDAKIIERFIHSTITKIREKEGMRAFFIAVDSHENAPLITSIAQFCDKVVKID